MCIGDIVALGHGNVSHCSAEFVSAIKPNNGKQNLFITMEINALHHAWSLSNQHNQLVALWHNTAITEMTHVLPKIHYTKRNHQISQRRPIRIALSQTTKQTGEFSHIQRTKCTKPRISGLQKATCRRKHTRIISWTQSYCLNAMKELPICQQRTITQWIGQETGSISWKRFRAC